LEGVPVFIEPWPHADAGLSLPRWEESHGPVSNVTCAVIYYLRGSRGAQTVVIAIQKLDRGDSQEERYKTRAGCQVKELERTPGVNEPEPNVGEEEGYREKKFPNRAKRAQTVRAGFPSPPPLRRVTVGLQRVGSCWRVQVLVRARPVFFRLG